MRDGGTGSDATTGAGAPGRLDDAGFDAADYARAYASAEADADRPGPGGRWGSAAARAAWIAAEAAFRYRLDHPVTVDRPEDVPAFAGEGEEADYWATHRPGPHLRRILAERGAPWPEESLDDLGEPVPLGGDERLPLPADLTRLRPRPAGPLGLIALLTPQELDAVAAPQLPETEAEAGPADLATLAEADAVPDFGSPEDGDAWWRTHRLSPAAITRWRAVPGNVEAAQARLAALRRRAAGGDA
jgi:hypothetical protein